MLDELEKTRCALDEAIEKLYGQLEPVLKQCNPSSAEGEPCDERAPQSDVCRRIDTHVEQLARTRQTIESIINRLDIPS